MFEQLIQFDSKDKNTGVIWSLTGSQYLAFATNSKGNVVKQADSAFANLECARNWLRKQGFKNISLRQSGAYLEMIGSQA